MKPVIGVLGNLTTVEERAVTRAFVNQSYIDAVEKAGGVPLVFPVGIDRKATAYLLERVDGLLVTGGIDVHPFYYDEEPYEELGAILPTMDLFHIEAVRKAVEMQMPILGICRGLQVMNVAFGGTLFQDLSHIPTMVLKHQQEGSRTLGMHYVEVEAGSRLRKMIGERVMVNSLHHQSIKDLAPDFKVVAKASDGVVEAIEKKEYGFCLGVQWHPEEMIQVSSAMKPIFQGFINATRTEGLGGK
ncbi:gamma-glutamyl-gamma-aminobutyrate hydrolase family protein [Gottschalkiaceae bacterium SANA]|nr:gamma-glutamyl-gamma-aminobutyrate hydrolase family protein [Gottschalkiaceae bacterium SANA]